MLARDLQKLKFIFDQWSKLCFSLLNAQPVTQILNGSYRTYILGDVGEIWVELGVQFYHWRGICYSYFYILGHPLIQRIDGLKTF